MAKQNLLTAVITLIVGTGSFVASNANAQAPCKHEELHPAAHHFHDSVQHLEVVASTCAPSHAEFLLTQRLSQKACAIVEAVEHRDPWSGILCDYRLAKSYMQTIAARLDRYCPSDLDRSFVCAWETAVSDWAVVAALVEQPIIHHHQPVPQPTWFGGSPSRHGVQPGLSLQSERNFRGLPSSNLPGSSFQLSVQSSGNRSQSSHRSGYAPQGRSAVDPREQFGSPFGNQFGNQFGSPINRGPNNRGAGARSNGFPSPFPTSSSRSNFRAGGQDDLRTVLINSLINRVLN